jgi:glycosyltransferase involved in cell wall biosynthesis
MSDKKYTIKLLYDVKYWAYYWQCLAMQKFAPSDFEVTISSEYNDIRVKKYDLILQCAFSYAGQLKKCLQLAKQNTLVVSTYSVGWGYANEWLAGCIRDSDWTIVNNYDMWERYGKHPKTITISNGVDLEKFYITKPIEHRKPKVLWVGSIGHRKVKNYDSILVPLSNILRKENIPFDFRLVDSCGKNRMNQDQMRDFYNSGTIYAVASSNEGTPNPAIEAAACGCTVVSTKVGNMLELIKDGINGYLCDTNIQSLYQGIKKTIPENIQLSKNINSDIQSWGWKERSDKYFDFFRKVINERKP